jgi:hypothetical protein
MSFIIAAVQARVDCAAGFSSGSLAHGLGRPRPTGEEEVK